MNPSRRCRVRQVWRTFQALLLLLVVGEVPPAAAAPLCWWVGDDTSAAALRGTLDELWPGAPVTPCVGVPSGDGIWNAAGQLTLVDGDLRRQGPAPADPSVEVALVRAWLRPPREPTLPVALPPAVVAAPPVPDSATWTTTVAVLAGPGLGVTTGGPPVHRAATVTRSWRILEVGGLVNSDLGAVLDSDIRTPVHQSALGVGGVAGVRLPLWGGTWVETLGISARWRHTREETASEAADVLAPSVHERMAWWRPATPRWSIGLGLSVEVEDVLHSLEPPVYALPGGGKVTLPAYVLAVELGAARRWGGG